MIFSPPMEEISTFISPTSCMQTIKEEEKKRRETCLMSIATNNIRI